MIKIYCLYDPLKCKIRYIGRTGKEVLTHRLIEHITKAKYFESYYKDKKIPHRVRWIKKVLSEGREPKIKLLCKIEGWKESHVFERALINKYKNKLNLTNSEDRGEGGKNRIVTAEDKKKISESLREYYKTNINSKSKTVYVFDLNGNYLSKYESARKCSIDLNIPSSKVNACCNNRVPKYKNWILSYNEKANPYQKKKRQSKPVMKRRKRYIITDLETNNSFEFLGMKEASLFLKIDKGNFPKFLKNGNYKKKYKVEVLSKSDELLETLQS